MNCQVLVSILFGALVLTGCDNVASVDQKTASDFVLSDPSAKIIWARQLDNLNIDAMNYQLPILKDRMFLPHYSFPSAQLVVLNAVSGQPVKQERFNSIFAVWAHDDNVYMIHDDTNFTALDTNLNILSEYNTIDRRMRSGLSHNELYYIFTEEDYVYDVFSMTTMQIIESKTSTITIDKKGSASLINKDGENIVRHPASNTDIYLSQGRSIRGKLFNEYAWIWSQGTLVRFDIATREMDASFSVRRGEFFISDDLLAIHQDGKIILIDPLSLGEIDQIPLPEANFDLNIISVVNNRLYILCNSNKIVAIQYEL